MSTTFPKAGLDFLRELSANNNKDWFQANKARYERDLKDPSRELVSAIGEGLLAISPRHDTPAARAISRINRDIRFSKDKTPYNTHVWAGWHPKDAPKGAGAGFFFGFSPESIGIGAGVWSPGRDHQTTLREAIAERHQELTALTQAPEFPFELGFKDAYKRVPKPWSDDHPAAELLKLKGFHYKLELEPERLLEPDLVPLVLAHFRTLEPVVAWLNRGLGV